MVTKLTTEEVYWFFKQYEGMSIANIAHIHGVVIDSRKLNKGKIGQALEKCLGIMPNNNHLDCSDGEIKSLMIRDTIHDTFTSQESIAITMVRKNGPLYSDKKYSIDTHPAFTKMQKVLFLCITKINNEYFLQKVLYFDSEDVSHLDIKLRLSNEIQDVDKEYESMIELGKLRTINADGLGRKSNSFLQIRTKDSKTKNPITGNLEYHPIVRNRDGVIVSDKSMAYYLRALFVRDYLLCPSNSLLLRP